MCICVRADQLLQSSFCEHVVLGAGIACSMHATRMQHAARGCSCPGLLPQPGQQHEMDADVSSLPLLSGVTQFLAAGMTSSLHPQNRRAVKILGSDLADDMRFEALFDPQTSGGLLGVFAQSDAENALQTLQQTNHQKIRGSQSTVV